MTFPRSKISKTFLILSAISIIFSLGVAAYIKALIQSQKQESNLLLYEVSRQCANVVSKEIDGNFKELEALAGFIGISGTPEYEKLKAVINTENNRSSFLRLGFVSINGLSYMVDNSGNEYRNVDFIDRKFSNGLFLGEPYVSGIISSSFHYTGEVQLYAVPIYNKENLLGVLFGIIDIKVLRDVLAISNFGGKGYSYIVDKDGNVIIPSTHPSSATDIKNFFNLKYENENDLLQMKEDMLQNKSGVIDYNFQATEKCLAYIPLGINDWYITSVVPKSAINKHYIKMLDITIGSVIIVSSIFILLLLHINRMQRNSRLSIMKLAYYDDLTGCYNKNRFLDRASEQLRIGIFNYAIVMFDINNFKPINELFGYNEGNCVLKHVVAVFAEQLYGDEIYARNVADNFCLMMRNDSALDVRLERIMRLVSDYAIHSNLNYKITCRCGVCIVNESNRSLDINTLFDRATLALSQSKGKHRNIILYYDEEVHCKAATRIEIEKDMIDALNNHEFVVYLQPKYDAQTEQIWGAEALVRWHHPQKGIIMPNSFIPLFEENGFITELDLYVVKKICQKMRKWIDLDYDVFPISVNQSRLLLYQSNYVDKLKNIISEFNIPARLIELEITESVVFENRDAMIDIVKQLHYTGFLISMDDFGSGYSSLNILKDLPIDTLKLDKEFFDKAADTKRGKQIISSIIQMAKSLSITTVSEGVETKEQVHFLKEAGCNILQGYYFSHPMSIEQFEKLAFHQNVKAFPLNF
ncbi:diguanylate cyclase/phosphodiesterase [Hydrogenoanaerobacterium saccharovorans]|uniref:Diguanylate cyclase/phosphodiesterase n=1 Tax=Hydrogenoanaerobacterium saccharovorans TaxID=474960 RepID=A0A1H7YY36_9FIRM|nr:EAL domain-containing protein [Hydrogenoanaerobacterium saccharovorans]RPF48926.1 diguanylate cyclase/phosphodiesterase [Hydrogenoanaerobacterium saccharovorans]SEM51222.1 diguanylate cyclase/phosphodiesterase [Hydrogenoanaerobacterium saccharovorans]